jgi:hypothetical protein
MTYICLAENELKKSLEKSQRPIDEVSAVCIADSFGWCTFDETPVNFDDGMPFLSLFVHNKYGRFF